MLVAFLCWLYQWCKSKKLLMASCELRRWHQMEPKSLYFSWQLWWEKKPVSFTNILAGAVKVISFIKMQLLMTCLLKCSAWWNETMLEVLLVHESVGRLSDPFTSSANWVICFFHLTSFLCGRLTDKLWLFKHECLTDILSKNETVYIQENNWQPWLLTIKFQVFWKIPNFGKIIPNIVISTAY